MAKFKPKKPAEKKPYMTTWQLTNAIFEMYLKMDEDKEQRHRALHEHELRKIEKELDARDGFYS